MERLEGSVRRSVNNNGTRVAIECIEAQVITPDFLAKSDEQEPPKDQTYTEVHARVPNLSQLSDRRRSLRSIATVPKIPCDAKTGDECVFQVVDGL